MTVNRLLAGSLQRKRAWCGCRKKKNLNTARFSKPFMSQAESCACRQFKIFPVIQFGFWTLA
jgi:hypothetical protein